MVDRRWTRLAGTLVFLAAVACGEETKTDHLPPDVDYPDTPPTVVSFQAAPGTIEAGSSATLQWTTRAAASIRIADEGGGVVPLGDADVSRGSVEVQPAGTTTYTLYVFGPGGEAEPAAWASATVTVTAVPPVPPTIEAFTASVASVPVGGTVDLSWQTTGAAAISIEDDAGAVIDLGDADPKQGTVTVQPPRASTVYYLVVVGAGRASASVAIEVTGLPRIARFFLDPIVPVHAGDAVTVTWETINATRVILRKDGVVEVDTTTEPTGSREIVLADTALFALEAVGPGEPATAQLQGRVAPEIVAFAADERVVRVNDPVHFTWSLENADRAAIEGPEEFTRALTGAELASGSAIVPVSASGDFVLRAFHGEVPETAVVGVEVTAAPRIRSLEVNPRRVTASADHPATVTLSWRQDGAETCTIFANNSVVPGYDHIACGQTGSAELQVRGDTTFRLVARNVDGEHVATVGVEAVLPAEILVFSTSPARRLAPGSQVDLSWEVKDAVGVSMAKNDLAFPIAPTAFTGAATDRVDVTSVYVLTAVNSLNFPTTAVVTVEVGPPAILTFEAEPDFVAIGAAFTLRWTADGGDRLVVAGEDGVPFFETTDPATIDAGAAPALAPVTAGLYTYTVTSTNGAGPTSAAVDVTVSDGPMIDSFTATPTQISLGETVTFTWSVRNDAYGNPPTLTLADNYGHTYPQIGSANQNHGTLAIQPAEEGQHVFTLTASTPNTTPHLVSIVVEVTVPPFLHAFTATPDRVSTNGGTVVPDVVLSWQTENAAEVTLWEADGAGNVVPPPFHRVTVPTDPQSVLDAGSFTVHPTATTWYVARAKNRVGTQVQALLKVTVDPPEVVSFTATPSEIAEGETVQLAWTTRNATTVRVDPTAFFVDMAGRPGAAQAPLSGDDALTLVTFPAGFTFPFEGTPRTQIQVSTNGWAGFNTSNGSSSYSPSSFPNSSTYVNFALHWADLTSGSGQLWYGMASDAIGDFFVVQWKNWSWLSYTSSLNFELILRPTGAFEYRYGTMSADPGHAAGEGTSIGFQGTTSSAPYRQLVPYQQAAPGGLARRTFALPTPSPLPVSGSLAVTPLDTTTFTLQAENADATEDATTVVTVWKMPVVGSVRTVPAAPTATQPFEIRWDVTHATHLRILDENGVVVCDVTDPVLVLSGSCSLVAATPGPKTYTLEAENGPPGQVIATVSRPFNFSVFPYLAVTSLTLTPGEFVNAGDQVTITWTTAGAAEIKIEACIPRTISCVDITPSGANPAAGSMTYTVTTSKEFRVHAYDVLYLEDMKSVSAWVGAGSLDTLAASTTQILAGGSTTLSWTSTDSDSVSITPPLPLAPVDVSATAPYVDVSTSGGTPAPFVAGPDSGYSLIPFPAGFTFPWFGTARNALVATTDGYLTFNVGYATSDWQNAALPTSGNPNLQIAPFWDDGNGTSPSSMYWKLEQPASGPRYLVIQWKDLELYSDSSSSLNFEVVLFENGDFDFRYGPMTASSSYASDAQGSSATIGFQSPDRSKYHQLSYNTAVPGGLAGKSWRYALNLSANGSVTVRPTTSTTYRICATNESLYLSCREVRILVIAPGDLLFSEALIAPADDAAEWFELRNMSPDAIDLAGWVLTSGTETYPIPAAPPLIVPAGGHVTFARSDSAGNGGFTPNAVYGSALTLDNTADTLTLLFSGATVDSVTWDATWTIPANQSLAVAPPRLARNPAANDPFSAWCPTTALYGSNTYGGSPGTEGLGCLPPPVP